MERIICAQKYEATPLVKHLKVDPYICGVKVNSLPAFHRDDFLINIGICAGQHVGEMYICNKLILEKSNNKAFYPDIPKCNILQAQITTIDYLATPNMTRREMLFDQEAATIYEQASKTLGPHQMCFIKIVSDAGMEDKSKFNVDPFNLYKKHIPKIKEILQIYRKQSFAYNKTQLKPPQTNLTLTETLKNRLFQQYKYAQITNINIDNFLNINTTSKKESIKILNQIDKILMEES